MQKLLSLVVARMDYRSFLDNRYENYNHCTVIYSVNFSNIYIDNFINDVECIRRFF